MASLSKIDLEKQAEQLIKDAGEIQQVSERVLISGFALAQPLFQMRVAQMQREIDRIAAKKGKEHPEVAARRASLQRTLEREARFQEELSRVRIDRPTLTGETSAGTYGRVAEKGKPVEGVTVVALAEDRQVDFRCTDANGAFAMEVPSESPLTLSVTRKDGAELHRDAEPMDLSPGEQRFREIDLAWSEPPCPDPGLDSGDGVEPVKVPDIQGRPEAEAAAILRAVGLKIGNRKTKVDPQRVGIVLEQAPKPGEAIEPGSAVDVVVGRRDEIKIPLLTGLRPEKALLVLRDAGLQPGTIVEVQVLPAHRGLVVDQQPPAGSLVTRDTKVSLQVGKGAAEAGKPNDFKVIVDRAEQQLRAEGLRPDESEGWLARRLRQAGIDRSSELARLVSSNLTTQRKLLRVRTNAEAKRIVVALRRAQATERK